MLPAIARMQCSHGSHDAKLLWSVYRFPALRGGHPLATYRPGSLTCQAVAATHSMQAMMVLIKPLRYYESRG